MRLRLLSLAPFALISVLSAAGPYSELSVVLRLKYPIDPVYASLPSHGRYELMFEGERLDFVVEILNPSDEAHTLATGGIEPAQDVKVNVLKDGRSSGLTITLAPQVRQTGAGANAPALWTRSVSVLPRRTFELEGALNEPLSPGLYDLQVETTLKDETNHPLAPLNSRMILEVRELNSDTETEVQRRKAVVAYLRGDLTEAERQVGELQRRSPNNFSVYSIRGAIAMARGGAVEARTAYDRAIEILQTGVDVEFRRWADEKQYRRAQDGMAALRERAAR
jgi:hypothetical protein